MKLAGSTNAVRLLNLSLLHVLTIRPRRTNTEQASTRKQAVRYELDALGWRVQRHIVGGKEENTKFIYDGRVY